METENILGIILIGIFISFLIYQQCRLIYNRYLRPYNQEIFDYAKANNLSVIEVRQPNNIDWKTSPFEKPKNFKISLVVIKMNVPFINWHNKDYKTALTTNKSLKKKNIWIEISTTYFKSPKMVVKEGKFIKEKTITDKVKFISIGNKCPACNNKIDKNDIACSDCGLHFN